MATELAVSSSTKQHNTADEENTLKTKIQKMKLNPLNEENESQLTSIKCPVCKLHLLPELFAQHQNTSGCFRTIQNRQRVKSARHLTEQMRSHSKKLSEERHKTNIEERHIVRNFYTKHFGNSCDSRRRAFSAGCLPISSQEHFRIGSTLLGSSFSRSGASFRVDSGVSDVVPQYSRNLRSTNKHTCGNCSDLFLDKYPSTNLRSSFDATKLKSSLAPCYHCTNWQIVKSCRQEQLKS